MAVVLALLLSAGLLFSYLWNGVHDNTTEGVEIGRCSWKTKYRSLRASVVNILPLRAIKIVVTVWQIISQVYGRCPPHIIMGNVQYVYTGLYFVLACSLFA